MPVRTDFWSHSHSTRSRSSWCDALISNKFSGDASGPEAIQLCLNFPSSFNSFAWSCWAVHQLVEWRGPSMEKWFPGYVLVVKSIGSGLCGLASCVILPVIWPLWIAFLICIMGIVIVPSSIVSGRIGWVVTCKVLTTCLAHCRHPVSCHTLTRMKYSQAGVAPVGLVLVYSHSVSFFHACYIFLRNDIKFQG